MEGHPRMSGGKQAYCFVRAYLYSPTPIAEALGAVINPAIHRGELSRLSPLRPNRFNGFHIIAHDHSETVETVRPECVVERDIPAMNRGVSD